jgi:hypothetical protein
MEKWVLVSDGNYELMPNGSSFVLWVRRDSVGTWRVFVSDGEVDEGRTLTSLADAQKAALAAYHDYWADFDEQSDGF